MHSSSRNVSRLLTDSASRYPQRTAIIFGDDRITYAALDAAASRVASLLVSRGIQPGDKVALSCPNLPHFTSIYYGILKAGAAVVPLNVLLKAREVAYHLADSDAKAYFAFEGTSELPIGEAAWEGFQATEGCTEFFLIESKGSPPAGVEPAELYASVAAGQPVTFETVERDDDDTAVILYTSGTTVSPRVRSCVTATCPRTRSPASTCSLPTPSAPTPTCACCRCSIPSARP